MAKKWKTCPSIVTYISIESKHSSRPKNSNRTLLTKMFSLWETTEQNILNSHSIIRQQIKQIQIPSQKVTLTIKNHYIWDICWHMWKKWRHEQIKSSTNNNEKKYIKATILTRPSYVSVLGITMLNIDDVLIWWPKVSSKPKNPPLGWWTIK